RSLKATNSRSLSAASATLILPSPFLSSDWKLGAASCASAAPLQASTPVNMMREMSFISDLELRAVNEARQGACHERKHNGAAGARVPLPATPYGSLSTSVLRCLAHPVRHL